MLKCIDLEGKEQWRVRGLGHGALTIADNRLLVTSSDGELLVAAATSDGFEELSRRPVIDGGVFWAGPVLSDGRIYVRGSLGDLVCLDHRGAGDAETALAVAAPSEGEPTTGELPSPEALAAGHMAACGLDGEPVPGLRMSGRLHVKALGLHDVEALWELDRDGRWHARFGMPPTIAEGFIHQTFQGYAGWEQNPFRGGNVLMEDGLLKELRSLGGPRSLLQPWRADATVTTAGREDFHGAPCYRVDVEVGEGRVRQVFFDAQSGRLQGRTSESESTVVLGDWREVGAYHLPFSRTEFHPESGEESRWRFSEVEVVAPDSALFEVPSAILELLAREREEGESEGEAEADSESADGGD